MPTPEKFLLPSAILVLGAGLFAPGGEQRAVEFGDPILGQRLFAEKGCVRCHAVRGAGGRVGPDLGRTTGDSYYDIASMMWNHSGQMDEKMREFRIARSEFEDSELSNLISFIYFLNYFDEPGDAHTGKILFSEKHCVRCHRVGAEGGDAGPPLDSIPRGASPLQIAAALWNHGPQMISSIEAAQLEVPQFAGNEIIDLFAFLRSQGERRASQRFQSPGDPVKGRALFESKGCSACHELFEDEPGVGPDLGRAELQGSVTQIAGRMWNHWPNMSRIMQQAGMAVPQLTQDELLDLLAYVFIARYEGQPGDPASGRVVFESKGCAVCHPLDGLAGIGPRLEETLSSSTGEDIMQAMWNHAPAMGRIMQDQDLSWVRLAPGELADLLSFLSAGLPPSTPPDLDR